MLTRRLGRKGYEVIVATDGAKGVEMAQSEGPALILMDLNLPVMDGWEATRRLKAAPETQGIPIIAVSAFAMASDREKALAAGCDDFLSKPIDFKSLYSKIETFLSGSTA
jgi:CheY-like chemotaxis protein